jgi:hypothetical protein
MLIRFQVQEPAVGMDTAEALPEMADTEEGACERDGILGRVKRNRHGPPEDTFLGDTDPRSKSTLGVSRIHGEARPPSCTCAELRGLIRLPNAPVKGVAFCESL